MYLILKLINISGKIIRASLWSSRQVNFGYLSVWMSWSKFLSHTLEHAVCFQLGIILRPKKHREKFEKHREFCLCRTLKTDLGYLKLSPNDRLNIFFSGQYLLGIANDYKEVGKEILQDMKSHPLKSSLYIGTLGTLVYFSKHNPTEDSFRHQLQNNANDLLLLSDLIRNPVSDNHVQKLVRSYNEGLIRRLSLGVCSLIWLDNYDKDVDVYQARCKSLKVGWLEMKDRIIDIGVLDRWIYMEKAMIDYDINPAEWEELERKIKEKEKLQNTEHSNDNLHENKWVILYFKLGICNKNFHEWTS